MADAQAYDDYEDAGLAFTDEELAAYHPATWAEERVAKLLVLVRVVHRYTQMPGVAALKTSEQMRDRMIEAANMYCMRLGLKGLESREAILTLPASSTAEGKELNKKALAFEVRGAAAGWEGDCQRSVRYVVTIGRRARSAWNQDGLDLRKGRKESRRSLSNRLANCVEWEARSAAKVVASVESLRESND